MAAKSDLLQQPVSAVVVQQGNFGARESVAVDAALGEPARTCP